MQSVMDIAQQQTQWWSVAGGLHTVKVGVFNRRVFNKMSFHRSEEAAT
jgi:hypothetical protein